MEIKKDVEFHSRQIATLMGVIVAKDLLAEIAPEAEFVVTSGSEPALHRQLASLHYEGRAYDFRTRNLTLEQQHIWQRNLVSALPDAFDIVLKKDHLHLEYDPR